MTTPEASGKSFARIQQLLRASLGTIEPVLVLPSGGGIGLEMLLRTAILHRAAVLVQGVQGEALARTAESLGKEVVRIVTAEDLPVDVDQVDRYLEGPDLDTLLVELDPATGLSPGLLQSIGRVVRRRRGMMLVADATRAFGRAPLDMDRWGVDAMFTALEGALGLPAGPGVLAISGRLLHRLRGRTGRGTLLDLVAYHAAASEGRPVSPLSRAQLEALERHLEAVLSPPRP